MISERDLLRHDLYFGILTFQYDFGIHVYLDIHVIFRYD